MDTTSVRPPIDPELLPALAAYAYEEPTLDLAEIPGVRVAYPPPPVEEALAGHAVVHEEIEVPGWQGAMLTASIFSAATRDPQVLAAAVLMIHGGGMYSGHRYATASDAVEMVERHGLVVVSVGYRLAPEHPDPIPVEDCYAALMWLHRSAGMLGADPARILVYGGSAGGGLAAGTALLARDRGGPPLIGQVLVCPMLDDRNRSSSAHQFVDTLFWDARENELGWTALLGSRRGSDEVSAYAAPARATDLSGLPPTFIDVGSAEVFREEDVQYAQKIWAAGGDADLHVWAGGPHGFDALAPGAAVSRSAVEARQSWIGRILARHESGDFQR